MKCQANLQALEYWGSCILQKVIAKSQVLSNKFIKKIQEVLPYNLTSKILYAISTKPIDMALNITKTIKSFFQCIFSLWPDSSEKFKV